jgi:hypothetical protein
VQKRASLRLADRALFTTHNHERFAVIATPPFSALDIARKSLTPACARHLQHLGGDDATIETSQREALGETLRELANLAAAALVLGQLLGPQPMAWLAVVAGMIVWLAFVAIGLALLGDKRW